MNQENIATPLSREEVIAVLDGHGARRIPMVRTRWWGEGLEEEFGSELNRFDRFPDDVAELHTANPVNPERMDLSWEWESSGAHDSRIVISDWAQLDEFIDKLQSTACNPAADPAWPDLERSAEAAHRDGRYVMCGFWNLFFEKPWQIRGMENLMVDFHIEQENLHRLFSAMADHYAAWIREAKRRLDPDGFWTSDDLGHQTGPMMSPETFHTMIYPYYCRVAEELKSAGLHFWLHSCGDNTLLLPDLIDAGVDVFHPVQKHTMDEKTTVDTFGGQITFLAGIDVQHVLQEETAEGVRSEVRALIDAFDLADGRMCIAAGNGIVSGTPIENIEAFLDESVSYGASHRAQFALTT